jgi:4-hydroxy-tetrahydrodipicolinate synthase
MSPRNGSSDELKVYPASVTPFSERGEIDAAGVTRLLARFKAAGCHGVVLAGTNGEGPSLSTYEKRDLLKLAADLGTGLDLVLGIATSSMTEAVWQAKHARADGATACLVMPPSYFTEAGQEGIARWFEAVFEESGCPLIVYNFPKRTGIRLEPDTIARLAENDGVLGFKDSSGEPANLPTYKRHSAGKALYVGNESLLLKALESGWSGTISGVANVIGEWLVRIVADWKTQNESACAKFEFISTAIDLMRSAPQPLANKHLLSKLGVLDGCSVRLPLTAEVPVDFDRLSATILPLLDAKQPAF